MSISTAQDLMDLKDQRWNESYLWEERFGRQERYGDWKTRLVQLDEMYRGEWKVTNPDGSITTASPVVMNLIQTALDDLGRLSAETNPTIRCDPTSDSEAASKVAQIREAIAYTYWAAYAAEMLQPLLAMDIAGAGAAFLLSYPSSRYPYPAHYRLDPRACYPDIAGGELQDLLVVQKMKTRKLARMYPDAGITADPRSGEDAEIIDYYSPDEVAKVVYTTKGTKVMRSFVVSRAPNRIERMWVSYARMDSFDGAFRGVFDQLAGGLNARNKLAKLITDHTDRTTHGAVFEIDVDNPGDYGPGAILHGRTGSQFVAIPPAPISRESFSLMEELGRETEAGAMSPAARRGEIQQSIASASFVGSVMGQLSTLTRTVQRHLAYIRQQQTEIDFALDEAYLNFSKPLFTPKAGRKSYVPLEDIKGNYQNRPVYGFGAGLDKLNQGVHTIQIQQSGLISKQTARENLEEIADPLGEDVKVTKERAVDVLFQKLEAGGTVQDSLLLVLGLAKGEDFSAVAQAMLAAQAQAAQQAQAQAEQQAAGAGQPGPEPAGVTAADQQTALQKGGIPGNAPNLAPGVTAQPLATPLPPLQQVITPIRPF